MKSKQQKKLDEYIGYCEHDVTITNECSDCNEQELFDNMLDFTLSEIYNLLIGTNNVVTDIIDDYQKHSGMLSDDIKNRVEKEVMLRLTSISTTANIFNKENNNDNQ
jgi:hypothetical protein|tara:strand:- start:315 stop:635 length:321 start_codon:yes stop_codon:yes gene_type:complete